MWAHEHQLDLHTVWSAASVAQHRILAAALRLDYGTHAASAPWLTMVVCKVLSCSVLGSTQQKRKAPDSSVDGQIKVPGNRNEARAPSPVGKKKRKSKAGAKPPKDSSSSSGDDSSSLSASAETGPRLCSWTHPSPWPVCRTSSGTALLCRTSSRGLAVKCRRSWIARRSSRLKCQSLTETTCSTARCEITRSAKSMTE
jgi:hypothetical protein